MASGVYNQFKGELMNGVYDLEADTVKVSLYDNSHSFTATDDGYTTTNELATSGGYTQGGATLASVAVSADTDGAFDATDTEWTSATFSAYHAVVWDDTPTSPANPLICSIDFGGIQTVSSGTFTIQWHADGIVNID